MNFSRNRSDKIKRVCNSRMGVTIRNFNSGMYAGSYTWENNQECYYFPIFLCFFFNRVSSFLVLGCSIHVTLVYRHVLAGGNYFVIFLSFRRFIFYETLLYSPQFDSGSYFLPFLCFFVYKTRLDP